MTRRDSVDQVVFSTGPSTEPSTSAALGPSTSVVDKLGPCTSTAAASLTEGGKRMMTRSKSKTQVHRKYDLVVIGGGSGGLSCALEAARLQASVALINYVAPSPAGSVWELGGTCINVGCVPKKLMHEAALLGEAIDDSKEYGWNIPGRRAISHSWETLREAIQNYIKSLNWMARRGLQKSNIEYFNGMCQFVDSTTLKVIFEDNEQTVSANNIVIAVGGRPKYPEIPGALAYGITSDDIFSLKQAPGKTLIIGGGYVGLECAGFLKGLGYETTVMIRSVPLRKFDQQMAEKVTNEMASKGIKFLMKCVPSSIQKTDDEKLVVSWRNTASQSNSSDTFDTVLLAVGRRAATSELRVETAGITTVPETGKIRCTHHQTNVAHIFAIGDCVHDSPELTPIAIQAGRLLAEHLFNNTEQEIHFENVPTTIFTPLEYGTVGLSEEIATETHGEENVEVYHGYYKPMNFTVTQRNSQNCYLKVITKREDPQTVIGIHFVGPQAGEVVQGFATAMNCGLTIKTLHQTVGIHPTIAEEFTRMLVTKRSGEDPRVQACCY